MQTGSELFNLSLAHIGERYVFGAVAPKGDACYKGAWDCAEFATWLVYQLTKRLYGCADNNGNPNSADAYTGFWKRDAEKIGNIITIDEAARTKGAFVLRFAGNGTIGHIAISDGNGGTCEAHSAKTGVIKSRISGRRWDIGVLIPWIAYERNVFAPAPSAPKNIIYRLTKPLMSSPKIKEIQAAADLPKQKQDGIFGNETFNAVRLFQVRRGLTPDGEVGKETAQEMGISI